MNGAAVRFGEVVFDSARGRLSVAGRWVGLDRSSAAILQVLLSEAGNEVAKDRLLEAGWRGRLVHENSLAKAIGRLRQALGADGEALETVHGFGYRLAVEPRGAPLGQDPIPGPSRYSWTALLVSASAFSAFAAAWLVAGAPAAPGLDAPRLIKGEAADSIGRVLWVDDHPQNNEAEQR